ncbi:MAG: hypothetical protein ACYTEK_23150 [Planctomycetota bacterium]
MLRRPGSRDGNWGRGFRPRRDGQRFPPTSAMPRGGAGRPGWRQQGDGKNLSPEAAPQERPWGPDRGDFRVSRRGEGRPNRRGRGLRPREEPDVDASGETDVKGSSAEPGDELGVAKGYAFLDTRLHEPSREAEQDDFWSPVQGEGRLGLRGRRPRPWDGSPIDGPAKAGTVDSPVEPTDDPAAVPETDGTEQPSPQ